MQVYILPVFRTINLNFDELPEIPNSNLELLHIVRQQVFGNLQTGHLYSI